MKRLLACLFIVFLPAAALANDISVGDFIKDSKEESQRLFRAMSEDMGGALAYRSVAPADSLVGRIIPFGFEVGADVSVSSLNNTGDWGSIGENDISSTFPMARITAQVGLPVIPLDFGIAYTSIPSSDIELVGYEARYNILGLDGGALMPALAVRLSHTTLSGVDNLSFDTTGAEVAASWNFAILTPYASMGVVKVNSDPDIEKDGTSLDRESFSLNRLTVGTRIALLPLIGLTLELDSTGDVQTYTAKLAARF
ncbi:hypothetical protein [Desulfurispira natronophila]|uniref:Uncharacterized protein n=1 Tax=Desulfurispira natronophila TaxID=682562 RepID=A0A7W7Y2Z1_9BACT|nr:hypothetical protein [Desulfurispira natronophila]MBB5021130.1 hypothetical protein [Desulfurispira natronophila]